MVPKRIENKKIENKNNTIEEIRLKLVSRGFNLLKTGENDFSVSNKWVKIKNIPGCGLINKISIKETTNGISAKGIVQFGTKNIEIPIEDISVAKWHQFFFQPTGFGQTSWISFVVIFFLSFVVSGYLFFTINKMLSPLGMIPTILTVYMTWRNFKRKTV